MQDLNNGLEKIDIKISEHTHKKNIILSKKEIKIVNHILDFKKVNKPNLYNNTKKMTDKNKNICYICMEISLEPIYPGFCKNHLKVNL